MDYIESSINQNNYNNEIELLKRELRIQKTENIRLANEIQVIKLNKNIWIKRLKDIRCKFQDTKNNNKPIRILELIENDDNIDNQNKIFLQERSRDFERLMTIERSIAGGVIVAPRRNVLHYFNEGEFSLDLLKLQQLDKNLRSPHTLFLLKCALDDSPYNSYNRITHDGQNRIAMRNLTWKKYNYAQYFETIFQNPKQLLDNAIRIDPGRVAFMFFRRAMTILSNNDVYVSNFEDRHQADLIINELYQEFLIYKRLKQRNWINYEYRWIDDEIVYKVLQEEWDAPLLLLEKCIQYLVDSSERYTLIIKKNKKGEATYKRTTDEKYLRAAANDVYFSAKILEILDYSVTL